MILQAQKTLSPVAFMVFGAVSDFAKLETDFDLILSNAYIQWIPNHTRLLQDRVDHLEPTGQLAVQFFLTAKSPIERQVD